MPGELPEYLQAVRPVPRDQRAAWYKTTAQTYASVMLWFVFWQGLPGAGGTPGGSLAAGLGPPLAALLLAGLLCHFLFYLVPGLLGMKTGLPLYVVGTSTYGAQGGLLMPGLLMGALQFGWIGVNSYAVAELLYKYFGFAMEAGPDGPRMPVPNVPHALMATAFAVGVAFVGLKGIKYVARAATFFPLIPLAVLVILFAMTAGGLGRFTPEQVTRGAAAGSAAPMGGLQIVLLLSTVVIGFFATAGAAGADIAMNNRDGRDVQLGGLTGVALATFVAGGLAVLVVAGAYGGGMVPEGLRGNLNPLDLMQGDTHQQTPDGLLPLGVGSVLMILLAISSFPGGCFSAYIAATSFRTTMPKVNPFLSVGLGTLASVLLAVTGLAGKVIDVFQVIGASFGPICGAMAADYLLSGRKWAGPRAGFNPAGWISWAAGFAVGSVDLAAKLIPQLAGLEGIVPVPPLSAMVVGFVLYFVLARAGLESRVLELLAPVARQD